MRTVSNLVCFFRERTVNLVCTEGYYARRHRVGQAHVKFLGADDAGGPPSWSGPCHLSLNLSSLFFFFENSQSQ